MTNIIVSIVIVLILALSITRIVKEKKKGARCIGCPLGVEKSKTCSCH